MACFRLSIVKQSMLLIANFYHLNHAFNALCTLTEFSVYCNNRDMSRTVIIPFNLPKIGAKCESDCQSYQTLGNLRKKISSSIGWAISLRKKLKETGISMINSKYLPMIFPKIQCVEPRVITGYSILLFFIDEVCVHVTYVRVKILSWGSYLSAYSWEILHR